MRRWGGYDGVTKQYSRQLLTSFFFSFAASLRAMSARRAAVNQGGCWPLEAPRQSETSLPVTPAWWYRALVAFQLAKLARQKTQLQRFVPLLEIDFRVYNQTLSASKSPGSSRNSLQSALEGTVFVILEIGDLWRNNNWYS